MNFLKHVVDFFKAAGREIDHLALGIAQLVVHYYGPTVTKAGIEAVKTGLEQYAQKEEQQYLTRVFAADTISAKTGLSVNDSTALSSHLLSLVERGGVELLDHIAQHFESAAGIPASPGVALAAGVPAQ